MRKSEKYVECLSWKKKNYFFVFHCYYFIFLSLSFLLTWLFQLCEQNSTEVYIRFFKRLVSTCYNQKFQTNKKSANHNFAIRLLIEETFTLSTNPALSHRFAEAVTFDNEALCGSDLDSYFTFFNLDSIQKTILCLPIKNHSLVPKYKSQGKCFF